MNSSRPVVEIDTNLSPARSTHLYVILQSVKLNNLHSALGLSQIDFFILVHCSNDLMTNARHRLGLLPHHLVLRKVNVLLYFLRHFKIIFFSSWRLSHHYRTFVAHRL